MRNRAQMKAYYLHEIELFLLNIKLVVFYFFGVTVGFLTPLKTTYVVISVLVFFDIVTALLYEFKQSDSFSDFFRNRFQSNKLKDTAYKLILYGVLLIVSKVLESKVIHTSGLVQAAYGYIASIEAKSIIENVDKTLGTKFSEFINKSIDAFKDKATKLLKN